MLSGMALLLGGMLIAAGLPKAVAPWYVASALRRVVTAGSDRALRRAGRLLGLWETSLGLALVLAGAGPAAVAVAALAALTFIGFAGFVVLAIRRGTACGCWASLSEGPAGGAELGRAVFLAALAVDLLLLRLTQAYGGVAAPHGPPYAGVSRLDGGSLGWAMGLLAGSGLAALLGGALLPVPTARLRRRLGLQAAPGLRGRAATQLRLLAGFVHAGTRAGRRRYLAARVAAAAPIHGRVPVRQASATLPPRPQPPRPLPPAGNAPADNAPAVPAVRSSAVTFPAARLPAAAEGRTR